MQETENRLTRIGVFYDGNFFAHVSQYYRYHHDRKARIAIAGLHEFIRAEVAKSEGVDQRYCQIVDAHYFRGRLPAGEAYERDLLRGERQFDDALIREGVITHYLPLSPRGETGIDVWLALEAYELAIYKRFNVAVLVTGDGDYLPLARKLNTLGTRVMVLGWDFKYVDERTGKERETRTNQFLLNEVSYPIVMSNVIEDRSRRRDPLIQNLFLPTAESANGDTAPAAVQVEADRPARRGVVHSVLEEGYGFIAPEGGAANLFFHRTEVVNRNFDELQKGKAVEYVLGKSDKGPIARRVMVIEERAEVEAT